MKAKTIPEGYYDGSPLKKYEGLVGLDPENPQTIALLEDEGLTYAAYVEKLRTGDPAFKVDANEPFLVRDAVDNKALYSDLDLDGYYDANGKSLMPVDDVVESEKARAKINKNFKRKKNTGETEEIELVQHHPHGDWEDVNLKGANCGPQVRNGKSITALFQDDKGVVREVHLDSIEILAEFYFAFNIDFKAIYGAAFEKDGCVDLQGYDLESLLDFNN